MRSTCSGIPRPRTFYGRLKPRRRSAPRAVSGTCATRRRGSGSGWSASSICLPTSCPTAGCATRSEPPASRDDTHLRPEAELFDKPVPRGGGKLSAGRLFVAIGELVCLGQALGRSLFQKRDQVPARRAARREMDVAFAVARVGGDHNLS